MDARQIWIWLLATAGMTAAAMTIGAAINNQALASLAGAMFAGVATVCGWRFAALTGSQAEPDAVSARFARLLATAWGWGGAAMLGSYYLTDLSWQHAWQYGLAMLLIAGGLAYFAGLRETGAGAVSSGGMVAMARFLTGLQGFAALAAVVILALSGKLKPEARDWAANVVFVAGGLAVFALSMAALRAERRARRG